MASANPDIEKFVILPDIHKDKGNGRGEFLEGIVRYVNHREDVGAVMAPGDFIHGGQDHPSPKNTGIMDLTANAAITYLKQKPEFDAWLKDFNEKIQAAKTEEDKQKITYEYVMAASAVRAKIGDETLEEAVLQPFRDEAEELNDIFGELKVPVYAVTGNHGLDILYDCLTNVTFVDNVSQVKHGDIVIKGANNCGRQPYDVPYASNDPFFNGFILPYLEKHLASTYAGDLTAADLLKEEVMNVAQQLKKQGQEVTDEILKKIEADFRKQHEDMGLEKKITDAHDKENARLAEGDKPDIFMIHKNVDCSVTPSGAPATNYLATGKYPVFAGHAHGGPEKWGRIDFDAQHPSFRPDPQHFHIAHYDKKTGKVVRVDAYVMVKASELNEADIAHLEEIGYNKKEMDAIREKYHKKEAA